MNTSVALSVVSQLELGKLSSSLSHPAKQLTEALLERMVIRKRLIVRYLPGALLEQLLDLFIVSFESQTNVKNT